MSVVSLKTYVRPARNPAFTRFNLFLRDRFECQYCGDEEDLIGIKRRAVAAAIADGRKVRKVEPWNYQLAAGGFQRCGQAKRGEIEPIMRTGVAFNEARPVGARI